MDLYGRPQASRRVPPSVMFLNERPKAPSTGTLFTPPTSARSEDLTLHVNGENILGSKPPRAGIQPSQNQQQQRVAALQSRPQSGGVRRPSLEAPAPKQRPSTARDGAARLNHHGVAPQPIPSTAFSKHTTCFSDEPSSPSCPETEEHSMEQSDWTSLAKREAAYIRQLKNEIIHVLQLTRERDPGLHQPQLSHVKNMQSMREIQNSNSSNSSRDSVLAQLQRYNFSSDPTQLAASKIKLESLLGDGLLKLMQLYVALEQDAHHQSRLDPAVDRSSSAERKRPPDADPTGCGTSLGSSYLAAFLSVLQWTEAFKTRILALIVEKSVLQQSSDGKDKKIVDLNEQLTLFKDALAKANSKKKDGSSGWTQLQDNWRIAVERTQQQDPIAEAAVASPRYSGADESDRRLEQARKLEHLEKELHALQVTVHAVSSEKQALDKELRSGKEESQELKQQVNDLFKQLTDAAVSNTAIMEKQRSQLTAQIERLEHALAVSASRYESLEKSSFQEKQQLRRDKAEIEQLLKRREEELQSKTQLLGKERSENLTAQLSNANRQVAQLETDRKKAEQTLRAMASDMEILQTEQSQARELVLKLQAELDASVHRNSRLSQRLDAATAVREQVESLLQQSEQRAKSSAEELEGHVKMILHQENQLQLLESKLSRSIPVDDEELQRRRHQEESCWHQKMSALEHALVSEQQKMALLRDQHQVAILTEREKATHAMRQAKTVADELETANLCIAERKRQREQAASEFEAQRQELLARIDALSAKLVEIRAQQDSQGSSWSREKATMECELGSLREQLATIKADQQLHAHHSQADATWRVAMEKDVSAFRSVAESSERSASELRSALAILTEERDELVQKLHALGTATPHPSAALPETRVELQRAKQKIASLKERLAQSDTGSSRGRDSQAQQAARLAEEQKALKKQRAELATERKQLQKDHEAMDADARAHASQVAEDRKLVAQVITLLAQRLRLQMELLAIVPVETASQRKDDSLEPFLRRLQHQHAGQWEQMHEAWARLQQQSDDADWQLVHMRNRLDELSLPASLKPSLRSTSPFSDAVASGRSTVPIAEALLQSGSSSRLTVPSAAAVGAGDGSPASVSAAPSAEEQETFAAALAKEMKAMKESYEVKIEELQQEIRQVQRLRMESTQRLRSELDSERTRKGQIIAQLTERCAELEAQLTVLEKARAATQDREIELLEQYADAKGDKSKQQTILRALHAVLAESCKEEMALRRQRQQQRMEKLHSYCGSSSVTVERDDKRRLH